MSNVLRDGSYSKLGRKRRNAAGEATAPAASPASLRQYSGHDVKLKAGLN
jgi:hypothetical protein